MSESPSMLAAGRRARPVHVVPHTHWDREWYRPFESYRYRLVRTLDRVLAAQLPYFLLDGQTAVIDDYLALRPDQAVLLAERIREGRLGVGPWFVLVDEFLVSGEALVRNLQFGRAAMRALGTAGEGVGYLPDMFGHVAQMPQILAQFGLDMAVVWRGVAPPTARFHWRAPDGSAVTAAWLPSGYYQTMFMEDLPVAERRAQLEKYLAAWPGEEDGPVWLLAGADHMAPRQDLASMIAHVQEDLPAAALEITSLRDALLGPAPTSVVTGELRDPSRAYILPAVLSARVPLKQANVACQTLLERYVEPLAGLAWWAGRAYPAAFVTHAWRTLMLNHPHDSICGCSIDQVHREMWPRFAAVEQVGEELLADAVRADEKPVASPGVFVFNPSGHAYDGWCELAVEWPRGEDVPAAIALAGPGLHECHPLGHEDTDVFKAGIDFNPDWFPVRRFKLAARVALPALGGIQLRATPAAAAAAIAPRVTASICGLENEHMALRLVDGLIEVTDKRTGRVFPNCHGFLDEGDAGDEYNFSPLADDRPRRATVRDARITASAPHEATLEVTYALSLPAGLSADRTRREDPDVSLVLVSRFTLRAGAAHVEVETTVDNQARDHRLRLVVGWPGEGRPRVLAEGTFGVFERPPVTPTPLPVPKGVEAVMPEFPTAGFTALVGPDASLAVAAPGLYEAAWLDEGALGLTLLRAVGWLSRDDLRTRGGGAGPRFETPEAQELGMHTFRYALIPGGTDWVPALATAHQFLAPPRAWVGQGVAAPGVGFEEPRLVVSALVRSQDGRSLVLRAFNATGEPVRTRWSTGLAPKEVLLSRMDETPGAHVAGDTLEFGPYEVKTLLLRR